MDASEKRELEALIAKASERGVEQALLKMGINVNDPIEAQKDFAFIRNQRLASEKIRDKIAQAIVVMFVTGMISLFIVGLKDYFNK